jgi:predicted Zn finger-like uncharacterized protein
MSIKMNCPTCGARFDLDDSQEGKTVRCNKCEEKFTVKPARPRKTDEDRPQRRGRSGRDADEDDDRPRRRRPRDDDEDERPRRRRSRDDDDDEDDRPRRRAPKPSGNGAMWIVLGVVAAVLILICGGGGLIFVGIRNAIEDEEAEAHRAQGRVGGFGGGPGQNFPPAPQAPPAPAGIQNLDDALAALKEKDRWRQDKALDWLKTAPPDASRRADVIAAIEPLVRERKGSGTATDLDALVAWGGKDSLPALVEALHAAGANDWVRSPAVIRALGTLRDPKAAPALVKEWRVGGPQDTAWALKQIGPAAEKDVLPAIDHPDDQVRAAARDVIRSYATREEVIAGQALTDLAGQDWGRRGAAASWLAEAAPNDGLRPKVVKGLDGVLTDALALDDMALRDAGAGKGPRWAAGLAADALVKWSGKDDLAALEHVVKAVKRGLMPNARAGGVFEALARTGDEKAVVLIVGLAGRRGLPQAADAIKRMGPAGERGLRKAVDDPDPEVQRNLPRLFLLVGLKDDLRLPKAVSDLKSDDKGRRLAGSEELGRIPADDAHRAEVVGLVRPLIDADDKPLRDSARQALIHWAGKDEVPSLLKILNADNTWEGHRQGVIAALGDIHDDKSIEALVGLVGGKDNVWAERALVKAGPAAEKPVRKLLESPDRNVRLTAGRVLRGIGVKDDFDFAPAWADAKSDEVQRRNAGLLALTTSVNVPDEKKADVLKLAEKLKDDSDPTTRQFAVTLLAKYATKDQAPALLKLMEGKAEGQRAAVIAALGRLKEEKAVPLLIKSMQVPTERIFAERALTDIGSASEKPLLEELKGDNVLHRLHCIRVLAKVGTKESVPALEEIAKDTGQRNKVLATEATKAVEAIKKR